MLLFCTPLPIFTHVISFKENWYGDPVTTSHPNIIIFTAISAVVAT